jgi:hypothetical protein
MAGCPVITLIVQRKLRKVINNLNLVKGGRKLHAHFISAHKI